MRRLDIVVADDHPIFVEGLQAILARPQGEHYQYNVVGVASDARQFAELLRHTKPDLLLLEPSVLASEPQHTLPSAKKSAAPLRVLAVASSDDPRLVKAALRAGADGYLLKSSSPVELFRAIDAVLSGQTFLGAGLGDAAAMHNGRHDAPERQLAARYGLTRRELEILRHIGQALNNRQIAEKLFISDQTVSVHRKNIMRKLAVNSSAALIKIAYEQHLV